MKWLDSLLAGCLPLVPSPLLRTMSGRYLAGESRGAAINHARHLATTGYRLTFDLLGEEIENSSQADEALEEYQGLLVDLAAAELEINLSIKPSQFGMGLNWNEGVERASLLGGKTADAGGFLRWEMEGSETVDPNLEAFKILRNRFEGRVGCVLQSMLHRTADDARALLSENGPLNVRLVKGVYVEPPEIAFVDPEAITASYLEILEILLEGGAWVGVASHDPVITGALHALLASHPEYEERCEVQMLLGVQESLRVETREAGIPVRVYLPYGSTWRAYVLRRLRQNPRLAGLAFQGMFGARERLKA